MRRHHYSQRLNRNSQHLFVNETTWSGGGGPGQYESEPAYQVLNITPQNSPDINLNGMRGAPDFSFDANPNTGVSVYDSTRCQGLSGWLVFGGTSVASPSLAGIVKLGREPLREQQHRAQYHIRLLPHQFLLLPAEFSRYHFGQQRG